MAIPSIDPFYFLIQLIVFPAAAVILGFFLHAFGLEFATHGCVLSPRFIWLTLFCLSGFTFCVLELDPCSVLGILPTQWRALIEYILASLLLNSAFVTVYMYVIVLSKKHLSKLPLTFTNLWVIANVLATLAIIGVGIVGAAENNALWFGICDILVMIQELLLVAFFHIGLHKVATLLNYLEAQSGISYTVQRRKLWVIRIAVTLLLCIDIANELSDEEQSVYAIPNPRPPYSWDPEVFEITSVVPSVLFSIAETLFLYAMWRPTGSVVKSKSTNNENIV